MNRVYQGLGHRNRNTQDSHAAQSVGLMVGGGMLLGTVGLFVEMAGQAPLTGVFFRCVIAALALIGYAVVSGRGKELRIGRHGFVIALITGLLMVVNWTLFFAAIGDTSIAVATLVFHVQPLWVMAYGMVFLGEARSVRRTLAALIVLGGLAVALGPTAFVQAQGGYVRGIGFALLASISYAAVTLLAKTQRQMSAFALATWQCGIGALVLAWWPWLHGFPHGGASWGWLVGLGIVPTAVAYVLLYSGMRRLQAGQIAILQFVYPVTAILVDWIAFDHRLSFTQWLGVVTMGVALWMVGRRASR